MHTYLTRPFEESPPQPKLLEAGNEDSTTRCDGDICPHSQLFGV